MDGSVSQIVERRPQWYDSDKSLSATTEPTRVFCLPTADLRRGESLLNQQFWLWGQDIRRQEDNALLRYGFTRTRPPAEIERSNCYTLRFDEHRIVALWGFGLFYGDRVNGGLYLSRFRLCPLLSRNWEPPVDVWTPSHLPAFTSPANAVEWASAHLLLVDAFRWVSAYESWILKEMGTAYRQDCLADWKRPVCSAADSAAQWLRLAHLFDDALSRTTLRSH